MSSEDQGDGQHVVPASLPPPLAVLDAGDCQAARNEDLGCAICMETLSDPFVTACGHTFCYSCLTQSLQHNKHCPACSHYLTTELIFPNFLLSKVVRRARSRAQGAPLSSLEVLQHAFADHRAGLAEGDVDVLVRQLLEHKHALQQQQREASMELLLHFLLSSREDKVKRLQQLQEELQCLEGDIQRVEAAGAATPTGAAAAPSTSHHARPSTPGAGPAAQAESRSAAAMTDAPANAAPGGEAAADDGSSDGVQQATSDAWAGSRQAPDAAQQQQQQLAQQQHIADFAGAAFASLAAHALGGGGAAPMQPPEASLLPGAPFAHGALMPGAAQPPAQRAAQQGLPPHRLQHHPTAHPAYASLLSPGATTSSGGASSGGHRDVLSLLRNKKRRIASQFEDLQQCYLQLRAAKLRSPGGHGADSGGGVAAAESGGGGGGVGAVVDEGLQEFSRLLSVITRCNKLKLVAEIARPALRQSTSIVSALEFDREGALFATAGVSKRISIFEFASVVPTGPSPGLHTPVVELVSRSKLTCLSWNKYVQAHVASSDYEGVVSVWDVAAGAQLLEYEAHAKRIWSVDFCAADPSLLASGSDDCAVKVWSTKSPSSVAQIDTKANVCTVRWRPGSPHQLALGSADHGVYLHDLRRPATPLATFRGHRKAVSYVRFCGADELVSASTDSTLRLWGLGGPEGGEGLAPAEALRVFEGHANEKNFVGLAVDGDFLACGSETSELYVYYRALSKPVAQQAFTTAADLGDGDTHHDKAFISAVCWRPGAQTLLAANSLGTVKVFSLTGSQA